MLVPAGPFKCTGWYKFLMRCIKIKDANEECTAWWICLFFPGMGKRVLWASDALIKKENTLRRVGGI